ncbi:SH3 domain protein, partial [Aspergillus nomiae NRRL 13137]
LPTMASQNNFMTAMTNRSLRTVRLELEFLADASVITPQQLSSIVSQLPQENTERSTSERSVSVPQSQPPVQRHQPPVAAPTPIQPSPAPYSPPTQQFANTSLNEKAAYQPPPQHYTPPPPAYPQAPPVLSVANALYAYTPTDPGDLALQPHDRVQVLEHMNADWWRGRNERTNLEGIFPRSYVSVIEDKAAPAPPSGYGNMPLEVSQGGSAENPEEKKPASLKSRARSLARRWAMPLSSVPVLLSVPTL